MKKTETKKAYMCGVAWQHEIGNTDVTIWPSKESLERNNKCSDECGIVEVEVKLKRWVKKQKL